MEECEGKHNLRGAREVRMEVLKEVRKGREEQASQWGKRGSRHTV